MEYFVEIYEGDVLFEPDAAGSVAYGEGDEGGVCWVRFELERRECDVGVLPAWTPIAKAGSGRVVEIHYGNSGLVV